jgi:hypothetical protein
VNWHLANIKLISTFTISDNDDDGETAAGGRLAHLLQILVNLHFNVVVKVTEALLILGTQQRPGGCDTLFWRYPPWTRQVQAYQPSRAKCPRTRWIFGCGNRAEECWKR